MTIKAIKKKYPESYVVLSPLMRDTENNKPLTFRVLTHAETEDEAERARSKYEMDGLEQTFIYQTHSPIIRELSPENTARLFRVMYGME